MATTVLTGKDGSVVIPGTPNTAIAKLTDWSVTINRQQVDTTALGDQWDTHVMGTASWSGKVTGFWVADEDTSQANLLNAILNGTALVLQLQEGQGRGYFEGTVDATQMNAGNNVKSAQSMDWSFVGNGQLNHMP